MGKWFAINRIDAIDNPASFVVGKMQVIGLRSFAALLETGSSMDRSVFYDGVAYELRRRKSELHIDAEIRPASLRYVSEWLVQQLIPTCIDQYPCAHWRSPMDMMRQG